MSLSTYIELKQEIIDWAHRGDIDLRVETFIKMAEQEMYANPDEVLRIRGQETRSTATTDGKYLALPDDFQSIRSLLITTSGGNVELLPKAPAQLVTEPTVGQPCFFAVTSQIEFDRIPDSNYGVIIQYYAVPAALSDTNATNTILTNFPNIYLFGALSAANTYANNNEEAAINYSSFIRSIKGANKKDKMGRYGPAPAMTLVGQGIA